MGYQKHTSYSSSKRNQKKNNYKPYNQSKKSDKKNENNTNGYNKKKSNVSKNKSDSTKRGSFSKTAVKNRKANNKTCKPVEKKIFKKPIEPNKLVIQVSTTDAVESTAALWISFKVNLTKYRKRLDEESALKITKFIQKNAGLFITNMDNEIHVDKLFSIDKVKRYIIKNWTYKRYKYREDCKSTNNSNRIYYSVAGENLSKPVYYINFNITEFFKDHLEYKTVNNSKEITRSMIIKTSMFTDVDNVHFRSEWISTGDLEEHKTVSDKLNSNDLYILFWNDKDLIDLYKTDPYWFTVKLYTCGSFKVKRITPESNIRYHKKMTKKEEK